MNWTGKAVVAPRSRLPDLIRREEAGRTGIYILHGPDPDRASGMRAYIGEADSIMSRLRRHEEEEAKDFFDRVGFVVAKDENLTKAHVRFLEGQLIQLTKDAGSVSLANSTAPKFARLPEADLADMRFFLEQMRIVLPIIGLDLFRPSGLQALQSQERGAPTSPVFELNMVGVHALGKESDDGFVVLAGSTSRRDGTATFPNGYRSFRDQLVNDGRLIAADEPALYRFAADTLFASPSAAASVVMARNASGPREWLVQHTNQTYADWRTSQLA